MIIIPTVAEKEFEKVEQRIQNIDDRSIWFQVDVMDNKLVSGKSFELELLTKLTIDISKKLIDIHLMVKEPINWFEKCIFVGANRIIGQVEMMSNKEKFVEKIKNEGVEAGLAFDIETPLSDVPIPEETDIVLLMGRKMGFGVYDLDDRIWQKIDVLKEIRKSMEKKFSIAVDGGVNKTNWTRLKEVGVDVVYCGHDYLEIYADEDQ